MKFASGLLAAPTLAMVAALVSVPAFSQTAPSPGDAGHYDGGSVTMDQFVARQTARIMAADTDGDGRVSRAEMTAMASSGASRGGRDPSRQFDAMDTNHDGYLDKDEIRSALEKRFHRMDLNGDGILTQDERMAGRSHQDPGAASAPAASQP